MVLRVEDGVIAKGGRVVFEWSKYCYGHRLSVLVAWLDKHGMFSVEVDGC